MQKKILILSSLDNAENGKSILFWPPYILCKIISLLKIASILGVQQKGTVTPRKTKGPTNFIYYRWNFVIANKGN